MSLRLDQDLSPTKSSETLYLDRLLVVAGRRNKWFRQKQVRLADLTNEPWLLPTGTSVARLIADAFRASGVEPPRATVSVGSPGWLTFSSLPDAFLPSFPKSMMRLNARNVPFKALSVALPIPPRPVVIVTLKNRPLARSQSSSSTALARSPIHCG